MRRVVARALLPRPPRHLPSGRPRSPAWLHGWERGYVESSDTRVALRSFGSPAQVLDFCAPRVDEFDAATIEVALRSLGKMADAEHYESVVGDDRFAALCEALRPRLADAEARTLSAVATSLALYRGPSRCGPLEDVAAQVAEVAVRRENGFRPRELANLVMGLSSRGVAPPELVEFARIEAMKAIPDCEPLSLALLLEGFRRWGCFSRELVDQIAERMLDDLDRFTARDVVHSLGALSRLGLAKGYLLRKLSTLAFDHLHIFRPHEVIQVAQSLAALRFLTPSQCAQLLDVLEPEIDTLPAGRAATLLQSLALAGYENELLARRLVVRHAAALGEARPTLASLVDMAWAICAFELYDQAHPLTEVVRTIAAWPKITRDRKLLEKLHEVFTALELEWPAGLAAVPPELADAARGAHVFAATTAAQSRLHHEVQLLIDAQQSGVNVDLGQTVGPYVVNFWDPATKVAIDLDSPEDTTSPRLRHRHLLRANTGAKAGVLRYWDWRHVKSEEDQSVFLKELLRTTRAIEA